MCTCVLCEDVCRTAVRRTPTSEFGTPSGRGYVVPMRMMVKGEVNLRCKEGALNLISTNYPDHGHHGRLPLARKNAHGRAGNRTRDLTVSIQELCPPSHEAGRITGIKDIN